MSHHNLWSRLAIMMVVMLSIGFVSCGGDEESIASPKLSEESQPSKDSQSSKEWKVCSLCEGNKIHEECKGTGKCQTCNGNGSYTKSCYVCYGNGYIVGLYSNKTCTTCEGTGILTWHCSLCNYTGKCQSCSGTGKCPVCNGEGGFYVEKGNSQGGNSDDNDNGDELSGWEVSSLCITIYNKSGTTSCSEEDIWLMPKSNGSVDVYTSSSMNNFIDTRRINYESSDHGYDVSRYSYYAIGGALYGYSKHYYFN